MAKSDIEWTDDTWNPTRGCKVLSPGCANCYAMRMAGRFSKPGKPFEGLITIGKNRRAIWNGEARLVPHMLAIPLSWKKPRRVFVNSMSDLFYEGFSNEEIAAVFGVMAACPHITFQILTKRAARMRAWFRWANPMGKELFERRKTGWPPIPRKLIEDAALKALNGVIETIPAMRDARWPLPNVWLGVSTENQDAADQRIPDLLETPSALRFLSCEPLLGPLDFTLRGSRIKSWDEDWKYDTLSGEEWARPGDEPEPGSSPKLDWVIAGCESGPGARHADNRWFRSIRDQCERAGVPFFLKQAKPGYCITSTYPVSGNEVASLPELDGKVHSAFPVVAEAA